MSSEDNRWCNTYYLCATKKNKITRDVIMNSVTQNNIYSKNYLTLLEIVPGGMGGIQ